MQIVYISNSFIPSRTANSIHVMKMCQAFADNGHEVVLLAPDYKEQYEKGIEDIYEFYGVRCNFEVVKLAAPKIKGRSIVYSLGIYKYLLSNKADLVYGRFVYGCYISALIGSKTIFESHTPIWKGSKLEVKVFHKLIKSKNFHCLVVISQALKDIYTKNGYLNEDKIRVAHDGADEVENLHNTVILLGNKNTLKLGYVGHLYKGRGIETIIDVAKELNNLGFHVVGGTQKDITYWKNETKKININNMYFYGYVPPSETIKYRNSFDILLAPYATKVSVSGNSGDTSKYMSPLKIFEYMSHRKPIITSDLPVLREILNEENAMLVEPENSADWINAILQLENTTLRKSISNTAYYDFLNNYTWKIRAKHLLNIINAI